MTSIHVPNKTQQQKIWNVLKEHEGDWVHGDFFLHTMYLGQFHARLLEIQRKLEAENSEYVIEAGKPDRFRKKSYRLIKKVAQMSLM